MQVDQKLAIPKLIMQTWKTEELPEKWKSTQTAIQKYMPDWEYVLMTDEMNRTFVQQHFPDFLSYYDAFPYNIQRADAVRYCWLYVYGGLYFDCDMEILGPLDKFFTEDESLFLLASSNTPDVITNGFMASKPGHPIWLEMIEEMKKPPGLSSLERHLLVMNTTGPLALNRVIKRNNYKYTLLPSSQLNPYTICQTEYNDPNAIIRPLEGSSWVGGAAKVYQWCYCHPNYLMIFGVVLLFIAAIIVAIYYNLFPF
jgi:mannosyltransferase OCH1-like enzyme